MARRKKNVKKTYQEFMSWLEGVECMQENDWTPNNAQWRTIREMLNGMVPDTKVVEKEVQAAPATSHQRAISRPGEDVATFVDVNGRPVASPSQVAPVAPVPQRLMPSGLQESAPVAPGVPAATSTKANEVLDTSDGNYTSEFM